MTAEERARKLLEHPLLMEATWTKEMQDALLPVVTATIAEAVAAERDACACELRTAFRGTLADGLKHLADVAAALIESRG